MVRDAGYEIRDEEIKRILAPRGVVIGPKESRIPQPVIMRFYAISFPQFGDYSDTERMSCTRQVTFSIELSCNITVWKIIQQMIDLLNDYPIGLAQLPC